VGFVVDKVAALGQAFSEYFGFPCPIFIPPIAPQSTIIWGLYKIGQKWSQYLGTPTPPIIKKK
jgi:hypothetical protein